MRTVDALLANVHRDNIAATPAGATASKAQMQGPNKMDAILHSCSADTQSPAICTAHGCSDQYPGSCRKQTKSDALAHIPL